MRQDGFEKLLESFRGNREYADTICSFIDHLTPMGFEHYISDYYRKVHHYTTEVTGGFNDKGMDIKGWKTLANGEKEFLIVQCKKWNWGPKGLKDKYYIGENLIAQFYGKVADHKKLWNIRIVYAVTKDVTLWGKTFCREKNIELITYQELIDIDKEMSLGQWMDNIIESDISEEEKANFLSKEYLQLVSVIKEGIELPELSIVPLVSIREWEGPVPVNIKRWHVFSSWTITYMLATFVFIMIFLFFLSGWIDKEKKDFQPNIKTSIVEASNIQVAPQSIKRKNIQKIVHSVLP